MNELDALLRREVAKFFGDYIPEDLEEAYVEFAKRVLEAVKHDT